MKIIDAHLHLFTPPSGDELARIAGHENSVEHLRKAYAETGMVHGVVMGNHSLDVEKHCYPTDMFHYCTGLDNSLLSSGNLLTNEMIDKVEEHLKRDCCCGIKLYPGYNCISLSDPIYEPIYELAAQYDKPVAAHMGLTANSRSHLKYCHPMEMDGVAADHPNTRFVLCHFGNPFLETASAVIEKNPNVYTDLSGILGGPINMEEYFEEQAGYVFLLKSWIAACECWDKIMYGTDWPLVNLAQYIEYIKRLIPEKHWEKVFFENANNIYGLGL